MNTEILKNILILDSIYRILDWKDRVRIHLLMQNKITEPSATIQIIYEWIFKTKWQAPTLKYGQDRLQYFENDVDEWLLVEEYRKHVKIELPCLNPPKSN